MHTSSSSSGSEVDVSFAGVSNTSTEPPAPDHDQATYHVKVAEIPYLDCAVRSEGCHLFLTMTMSKLDNMS
jgi:hypothetical protein